MPWDIKSSIKSMGNTSSNVPPAYTPTPTGISYLDTPSSSVSSSSKHVSKSKQTVPVVKSDTESKRKWHEFHCDPRDEVVLKSEDDMYFRASRHRLVKSSTLFKDSFELDTAPVLNDPDLAVALPFSSEQISNYLDAINAANISLVPFSALQCLGIRDVALFTDSERVTKAVDAQLDILMINQPFVVIVAAGDRNDIELAKRALGCVNNQHAPKLGNQKNLVHFWDFVDKLPRHWAAWISRNAITSVSYSGDYKLVGDWTAWKYTFNPDIYKPAPGSMRRP